MRIVLDTNILVRANPKTTPAGLASQLLLTIATGPHSLILSRPILTEVRRVLSYPHVKSRWPLTEEAIDRYINHLEEVSEVIEVPNCLAAVVRDPDEDPILQTAISGRADVLCTRDAAFRHEIVKTVCRAHRLRILDDITLMHELRGGRGGAGS